jgi:RNA polymerase sigma factor (TIGR02999 family)
MDTPSSVTHMLASWARGNHSVSDRLFSVLYGDLHRVAARQAYGERSTHTLQPTVLVHEAYLQLVNQTRVCWQSRDHFLGVAAYLMRRILLKHAERRRAAKRGGGEANAPFDEDRNAGHTPENLNPVALSLREAVKRLTEHDPRQGRVVEKHVFEGYGIEEIAELLNLSTATIKREWRMARAWLYGALTCGGE